MTDDELRTTRLLFDTELREGFLSIAELRAPAVLRAVHVGSIPPRPMRVLAQVRYKLGERSPAALARGGRLGQLAGLSYERSVAEPQALARAQLLGEKASKPSRFLVRVDEFPHFRASDEPNRFGTSCFERFHEIMAGAGVPYMVAVLPRLSRKPLSPSALGSRSLDDSELAMLERLRRDRVAVALHGRDHRSRFSHPRRRSELAGLSSPETEQLVEGGLAELAAYGLHPTVFVPPFNRFEATQFSALARRFAVVCGGPESIGQMGFQATPQWRAGTVYLPAYAPFYGAAREMVPAVSAMIERAWGLWVPVVLHWAWERRAGWRDLERLAALIAQDAAAWDDFLTAVHRSGGSASADPGAAASGVRG